MTKTRIIGAAFLIGVIAIAMMVFSQNRLGATETGPAPAWQLKDWSGKTVKSTDFKGKVVILDFWATWCPPCRAEIPSFVDLQKKYAGKGLEVVGVSVDQGGPDVVKDFVKKNGMNYPVVMADEKVISAFGGIEAVPTTFVIDRKGNTVQKHIGLTDKDEFEAEIKPLLAQ